MNSNTPFTISGIDPALTPYLRLLLLVAIWSATLVPLLLMLMFFSSERLRRTPVFWLNVLAISLGMALGTGSIIFTYNVLINPDDGYSIAITVMILCFEFIIPLLVEFILLCRLLAVYSFHLTPLRLFASIFCSLGCLKMARIANFIVFINYYARHAQRLVNPLSLRLARLSPKIEWILQTIDNTITSSLFLRQLNLRQTLGYHIQENGRYVIVSSVSSKIRTLFWIAASNFVIPVILNIALLIDIFRNTSSPMVVSCLEYSNVYVQIIGVVLATLWAAGSQRLEDSGPTTRFAAGLEVPSISVGVTETSVSHPHSNNNYKAG